jgi:hypothetical protein
MTTKSDLLSEKTILSMSNRIFLFENGELEDEEVIELFQDLIETKMIFSLQGSYQRIAQDLIEQGLINEYE